MRRPGRDWLTRAPLLAGVTTFGMGLCIAAFLKHGGARPSDQHVDTVRSTSTAQADALWCTCYSRRIGDHTEPVTACRGTRDACESLRNKAEKGSPEFIANSTSPECTRVTAEQWVRLDGKKPWSASKNKNPGAWVNNGTCLLE